MALARICRASDHTRLALALFFFFSSRRRHTRLLGDWSSDVCSSDLEEPFQSVDSGITKNQYEWVSSRLNLRGDLLQSSVDNFVVDHSTFANDVFGFWIAIAWIDQIGRASCRERV